MSERDKSLLKWLISTLRLEFPFLIDTTDPQIRDERIILIGQAMEYGLEKATQFGLGERPDLRVKYTQDPDRVLPEVTSGLCQQASRAALRFLYSHSESPQYFSDYWLIVSRRFGAVDIVHQLGAVTGSDGLWYAFSPANLASLPGRYDRKTHIITAAGDLELVENIEAVEPILFSNYFERLKIPYRGD